MNENQPRRHLITPIVVFGITALIAVVMLLWALVIWLAQLTGSMIWATLILGGVFALIALIVYLVSVRPAVQYISDQLDNIAEMAQIVRSGYNWITDKLNSILCSKVFCGNSDKKYRKNKIRRRRGRSNRATPSPFILHPNYALK